MLPKKYLKAFVLILIFQIILLSAFVFLRLVDFDEGLYLSSAYQVGGGRLPYLDFFYNQMPYLPYAYALISDLGFSSLFFGRLISATASVLLGMLLLGLAHKLSREVKVSLSVFFLYSFQGLIIAWHSTIKTLTFSDLLSFTSFIFFSSYVFSQKQPVKNLMMLFCGFFAGLAFNFRLTHLVILVVVAISIFVLFRSESIKRRLCSFVLLLFGAILSSSLTIYLFFKNPQIFLFDNLVFRQMWGVKMIKMSFGSRLFTLFEFLFYPQDLFILILFVLSVPYLIRELKKTHSLASENQVIIISASLALSIMVIGFVISPTQLQYFEQALPFLLIAGIPSLRELKYWWQKKKIVVRLMGASYLLFILPFILIFIFGVREKDHRFQLKQIRGVVEVIQENSRAKEEILALWPGYAVLSGREALPGLEAGGWETAHLFSPQQLEKVKLIDHQKIEEIISEKKVGLLVGWNWIFSESESLLEANYEHIKTVGDVKIYKAK